MRHGTLRSSDLPRSHVLALCEARQDPRLPRQAWNAPAAKLKEDGSWPPGLRAGGTSVHPQRASGSDSLALRRPWVPRRAVPIVDARGMMLGRTKNDVKSARGMGAMLMAQLKDAAGGRESLEEQIKSTYPVARCSAMLRAVSLPQHAATLRDLTVVYKNLIPLECQAFGIDDKPVETSYEEL